MQVSRRQEQLWFGAYIADAMIDDDLAIGRVSVRRRGRAGGSVTATRTRMIAIAQVDLPDHRLHVVGKGSKHRTVVLGEDATELLRRYLDDIRPQLVASDFVFVNPMSSRTSNWVGRYGESAYQAYFTRIGQISGLPGKHFPHRTRHTYATEMLRMGLDVTEARIFGQPQLSAA